MHIWFQKTDVGVADLSFIKRKSLTEFWLGIRANFSSVSEMALNIVLPFCTMNFCKAAFSVLIIIKSKHLPPLKNAEDALNLVVLNAQPRCHFLCKQVALVTKSVFSFSKRKKYTSKCYFKRKFLPGDGSACL